MAEIRADVRNDLTEEQQVIVAKLEGALHFNTSSTRVFETYLHDFISDWKKLGRKAASDRLTLKAAEAVIAEREEQECDRQETAVAKEDKKESKRSVSPPQGNRIFSVPKLQNRMYSVIHEQMTPRERAAAAAWSNRKQWAARRGNEQFADQVWGGYLDHTGYEHFMFSPAIALLPKSDFGDGKIDIRLHRAKCVEDRCYRIDDRRYHFEMEVWPGVQGCSEYRVREVSLDAALIYNDRPGFLGNRSPFAAVVVSGQPWALWMNGWGFPLSAPYVTVAFKGTYLHDFAARAQGMCDTLDWRFAAACRFVATGEKPEAFPAIEFDGRYTFPFPMGLDTIHMRIAPHVSPATVKGAYEAIQRHLFGPKEDGKRPRSMSELNESIFVFVSGQMLDRGIEPDPTKAEWQEMYQRWTWPVNTADTDKRLWQFKRRYRRALTALSNQRTS